MTGILLMLGISAALGLLVGLQRERTDSVLAGIRTVPLATLLGSVCALLADRYGGWVLAAGFVALTTVVGLGAWTRQRKPESEPGLTSEVALLLMFAIGAYLPDGNHTVAVVLGAVVAVLLHLKPQLHTLARRIGDADFRATMQFVVISLVILPVLPDTEFGPYGVLNPHRLWWMVVLTSGISLGGYALYKMAGARLGTAAGGLLGGLISSTATTVSFSRRTLNAPGAAQASALVILMASAVVFARVLVEMAVVAPSALVGMGLPAACMLLWMTLLAAVCWWRWRTVPVEFPEQTNPTELRSALVFAALYAGVLLAVAAAREHLGGAGLMGVAVVSGLTDMDAITLSSAQLVNTGRLSAAEAGRTVLLAGLSNLVFKGLLATLLGHRVLARHLLPWLGAGLAGGLALLATLTARSAG